MANVKYDSPFNSRYASDEMKLIFSDEERIRIWRKLWIALAESEKELGLSITDEQINELIAYKDRLNMDVAAERESLVRHDVMAHIYAYGLQCPLAKPIIHLGATSCYVGDNSDIILMVDAMRLIRKKVVKIIANLSDFAMRYKDLPALGYTHLQPAQLTTVGKRTCLWIQDLMFDVCDIDTLLENMKLLGSKGTTGTQASFMELFDGDFEKVKRLDELIAQKMGFSGVYDVSGQTYSRKIDHRIMSVLSGTAQSAAKFSNDIRLLQHLKEIEEPFEKNQIGSSAMAYKRNPMRCERIAGLARFVIVGAENPALTAAAQWFERTLDDSSNKRLAMTEAFLAVDSILNIYMNVSSGLVVYPNVINKHVIEELPFMATENILMDAVKNGGDRQELHERIRIHSMAASENIKQLGLPNNLLELIASDSAFNMTAADINTSLSPEKYVGFAPVQTEEYVGNVVAPFLAENYTDDPEAAAELRV